jgi:hypothetical protein
MSFNFLDVIRNRRVVIVDADTTRPEELRDGSWDRKTVEIREKPVVFGRIPSLTDVCLPGRTVAKQLFEIRLNNKRDRHEIQVYHPCVYPPSLNGRPLLEEEPSPLFVGDILTIGPFRIEYTVLISEDRIET